MSNHRSELAAILTRASVVESQRQAAIARGDNAAAREYDRELRQLWAEHRRLGGEAA